MVRFSVEDEEMSGKKRKGSSKGASEISKKGMKLKRKEEDKVEEQVEEQEEEVEGEEREEYSDIENGGGITVTLDPDVLDCSICFEPLRPPLLQCRNGHVACSSCTKHLKKCHICSDTTCRARCLTLEKVIESIKVSCSYARYGCKISVSYTERLAHEESCKYAPCFCPMLKCTFSGSTGQFSTHFDASHKGSAMNFCYGELFEADLARYQRFLVLLEQHGDLFLLLNGHHVANGNALSVACIRPNSLDCDFKYELTARGSGSSLQVKASTTNFKKWEGAYPSRVFLLVPFHFCSPSGVHLNVCIRKN